MEIEIDNKNNQEDININETYKKLESNKLISYELSTNNKINKDFALTEKE